MIKHPHDLLVAPGVANIPAARTPPRAVGLLGQALAISVYLVTIIKDKLALLVKDLKDS